MTGDDSAQAASVAKDLKAVFLREAKWRRQKAVEYPNDKRNLEAAKIFERLANSVGEVDPPLLVAYGELREEQGGDTCAGGGAVHSIKS